MKTKKQTIKRMLAAGVLAGATLAWAPIDGAQARLMPQVEIQAVALEDSTPPGVSGNRLPDLDTSTRYIDKTPSNNGIPNEPLGNTAARDYNGQDSRMPSDTAKDFFDSPASRSNQSGLLDSNDNRDYDTDNLQSGSRSQGYGTGTVGGGSSSSTATEEGSQRTPGIFTDLNDSERRVANSHPILLTILGVIAAALVGVIIMALMRRRPASFNYPD